MTEFLENNVMFENILVPLDGSLIATCVLPHVVALSRTNNPTVSLLRVMESGGVGGTSINPVDWQLQKSEAQSYLEETGELLAGQIAGEIDAVVLEGRPADRIIEYAYQMDAD
ncbi:MAG: universal stress protein, partial [Caldilineaceae bacterium]|nr:universal stress protein [Caldilineaceae bacterium]